MSRSTDLLADPMAPVALGALTAGVSGSLLLGVMAGYSLHALANESSGGQPEQPDPGTGTPPGGEPPVVVNPTNELSRLLEVHKGRSLVPLNYNGAAPGIVLELTAAGGGVNVARKAVPRTAVGAEPLSLQVMSWLLRRGCPFVVRHQSAALNLDTFLSGFWSSWGIGFYEAMGTQEKDESFFGTGERELLLPRWYDSTFFANLEYLVGSYDSTIPGISTFFPGWEEVLEEREDDGFFLRQTYKGVLTLRATSVDLPGNQLPWVGKLSQRDFVNRFLEVGKVRLTGVAQSVEGVHRTLTAEGVFDALRSAIWGSDPWGWFSSGGVEALRTDIAFEVTVPMTHYTSVRYNWNPIP